MIFKTLKYNKLVFFLISIVYFIFSALVITVITDKFVQRQGQHTKDEIQHEVSLVRYSIEANIFREIYLADSFATVVALDPLFATENWKHIAIPFLSKTHLTRNIGLAPNDIITHVYPEEGNEKAIGLDFRTVPLQYKTVMLARKNKAVFIAGPLNLVQGGKALIARYPIFTDIPHNTEYWGGLSVVLNYQKLIDESKFHELTNVDIALVAKKYNGEDYKLIEGDQSVVTEFDLRYPINLPNARWILFAKYKKLSDIESIHKFEKLFITLGTITFVIGYLFVMFLFYNYSKVQKLSLHDELTHLPNRRFLFNELNRIMARKDVTVEFSVLNIDLNKFKHINDSLGHEAGDQVLKHVASLLTKCLRSSDFVSRVGGDEFVIILPRTTKIQDVEQIMLKIQSTIESTPVDWKGENISLSVSVGYYSFKGNADKMSINEIMAEADKKMYQNKMSNR